MTTIHLTDTEILYNGKRYVAVADKQPEQPKAQTPEEWCRMIGVNMRGAWSTEIRDHCLAGNTDWVKMRKQQELVQYILAYATRYYNTLHPMEGDGVYCRKYYRQYNGEMEYIGIIYFPKEDKFSLDYHYFHRAEDRDTTYAMIEAIGLSEYLAIRTWEVGNE